MSLLYQKKGTKMSNFELEENTGTLFKNENKTEDKHPSYKGSFKLNGNVMDIAIWKREGKSGKPYLFVKLSDKKDVKQTKSVDDGWGEPVIQEDGIPF